MRMGLIMSLLLFLAVAGVAACVVTFSSENSGEQGTLLTRTVEIQYSTDWGDTWTDVSTGQADEAVGKVFLGADDQENAWVGVQEVEESTTTLYRVNRTVLTTSEESTFDDSYGGGPDLTLSWDANGEFAGVSK